MSFTRLLKRPNVKRKKNEIKQHIMFVSCLIFFFLIPLITAYQFNLKLILQGPLSLIFSASKPHVTDIIVTVFYSKGSPKDLEISLYPENLC